MSWRGGSVPPGMRWADCTTFLSALRWRAEQLQYQAMDDAAQDALNYASVKVCEGLRGQYEFLQLPEVE